MKIQGVVELKKMAEGNGALLAFEIKRLVFDFTDERKPREGTDNVPDESGDVGVRQP